MTELVLWLHWYTDSEFAGDDTDRKSTYGNIILLGKKFNTKYIVCNKYK